MDARARRSLAWLCCLAVFAGPAGCRKKNNDDAGNAGTTTTTTTPPPTTTTAQPVTVTALNVGKSVGPDKRVTSEVTQFGRTDTIYASVQTSGTGTAMVRAHWTFEDGQTVSDTTHTITAGGMEATEFHISKPDGWPTGRYKVEVSVNGTVVQSKEFTVQ
jgi:hypothetical protein